MSVTTSEKQSEISVMITSANERLDKLGTVIGKLRQKLTLVLSTNPLTPESKSKTESVTMVSPLGDNLQNIYGRINKTIQELEDLITEIQL